MRKQRTARRNGCIGFDTSEPRHTAKENANNKSSGNCGFENDLSNRDHYETISAGTFREDLFDRLSVFSITWPPLRERRSDIPHITDRLLTQINRQFEQEKSGDILQPLISKQLLRKVLGSGMTAVWKSLD